MSDVEKIGQTLQIPAEFLRDAVKLNFGNMLTPEDPKQRAVRMKRQEAERQEWLRAADENHARLMQLADPIVASVLHLHRPLRGYLTLECGGCEFEGYEAESPGWPCKTYDLIAKQLDPEWSAE